MVEQILMNPATWVGLGLIFVGTGIYLSSKDDDDDTI